MVSGYGCLISVFINVSVITFSPHNLVIENDDEPTFIFRHNTIISPVTYASTVT
jgi:hypothetical protein